MSLDFNVIEFEERLTDLTDRVKVLESNNVVVPITVINDNGKAKLPVYANPTDAGADLFANETIIVSPGRTVIVHTGLRMAIPEGYEVQIRPRSGLSLKTALRVPNAPGTIDSGYRDEIGIEISRDPGFPTHTKFDKSDTRAITDINGQKVSKEFIEENDIPEGSIVIQTGDRIAQMVLCKVYHAVFEEVDDVSTIGTNRNGGFGHTGV